MIRDTLPVAFDSLRSHPSFRPEDEALVRLRRPFGDAELIVCSDGPFLLDGGAMFGVVPKPLWSATAPADDQNRIYLGLNTAVLRLRDATVLIETGLGNKQPAKMRAILDNCEQLPQSLAAAGVRPEDVTHVINTHLHFDHCGWNTTLDPDGSVRPTFPNARYFAAAGELAHGRLQLERDRVSYLAPNYDPLIRSGQLTLIDLDGAGGFTPDDPRLAAAAGDDAPLPAVRIQTSAEILPGVRVERFPGHTADMLAVHLERGGEHACFCGDLFPTHHHLNPTWVMGYDLDPVTCIRERHRFLDRAIAEQWLVLFPHDHHVPAARLALDGRGRPVAAADPTLHAAR